MENFANFNFIFYDLETTALDVYQARILEIAACYPAGDNYFHAYVKYPWAITNSHIHGITQDVLQANNAQLLTDVLTRFRKWIEMKFGQSPVYLVAYNNLRYDKPVLEISFKRIGQQIPANWYFMDPYPQIKELYQLPSYKLTNVYQHLFHRPLIGAHGALADTRALYEVYLRMVQEHFYSDDRREKIRSMISQSTWERLEWKDLAAAIFSCYVTGNDGFSQPTAYHPRALYQKVDTLGAKGYQLQMLQEEGFMEIKDLLIYYLVVYPNFIDSMKKLPKNGGFFSSKAGYYLLTRLDGQLRYYAYILYDLTDKSTPKEISNTRQKIKILD